MAPQFMMIALMAIVSTAFAIWSFPKLRDGEEVIVAFAIIFGNFIYFFLLIAGGFWSPIGIEGPNLTVPWPHLIMVALQAIVWTVTVYKLCKGEDDDTKLGVVVVTLLIAIMFNGILWKDFWQPLAK